MVFLVRKSQTTLPGKHEEHWPESTQSLTCSVHLAEQPPALGMEWHPGASLQLLGGLGGYVKKNRVKALLDHRAAQLIK